MISLTRKSNWTAGTVAEVQDLDAPIAILYAIVDQHRSVDQTTNAGPVLDLLPHRREPAQQIHVIEQVSCELFGVARTRRAESPNRLGLTLCRKSGNPL